jgi:hypothetical protein
MQTFLPYPSFTESLKCLDDKRLGKQRVEAMQILKALYIADYGWNNHPCVKMWQGYEYALVEYMNKAIKEWKDRGFNNTMLTGDLTEREYKKPQWLGNKQFHISHQSNLLRKDYKFYSKYNWHTTDDIPYYWNGFAKDEGG